MMLYMFNVDEQKITLVKTRMTVSGTVNEYYCLFRFSSDWNGYAKTAVFMQNNDTEGVQLKILSDGLCGFPASILKPNTVVRIGVYGVKGNKTKPTIYSPPLHVNLGAKPYPDDIPPEPGVYDQILTLMEETKAIAQSVRDDADAGKFKGDKGDPGEIELATADKIGGFLADPATPFDTSPVRIGADGKAYTAGGSGGGINVDDSLIFDNGVLKVNTQQEVLEDNTLPVASGAVYVVVGNIESLLGTI